jgi:ArsR family transcriptional regulator, lead/cadmium/zinc/bismuth-responsive transcriptional repressor
MATKVPPTAADMSEIPYFDRERVAAAQKSLSKEDRMLPLLVELYKLLGNSTRLKILLSLRDGEMCVSDMAHVLHLSIPATSHQLKLLRNHGWIKARNDGRMAYYQLDNDEFRAALDGDLMLLKSRLG